MNELGLGLIASNSDYVLIVTSEAKNLIEINIWNRGQSYVSIRCTIDSGAPNCNVTSPKSMRKTFKC